MVHEAGLPPTIRFHDLYVMAIRHGDPLELPTGFVGSLAMAVQAALENRQVFGGAQVWVNPRPVAAYREALKKYTREAAPYRYDLAQQNMALTCRGCAKVLRPR
jgi:hypothetical protein